MRLDKFLKVSRLIKRRTVAKDFAEHERVTINGRIAKASSLVNIGDVLEIQMGARRIKVEILDIRENIRAEEAANLYRVIE
ncbi:MAG: RNA-binding S4 domain-containing protein, partial [Chitinophagales bacterium]